MLNTLEKEAGIRSYGVSGIILFCSFSRGDLVYCRGSVIKNTKAADRVRINI